ncbi:MMPL family transporter [Candidatus Woesearchaeota archaeon]|nr:MMPL family transporter [Candidatus Woesearchaeota archaeon]USN43835.1 MAG: MMPL family transporter [Candidatus Woesearchaeota archaeon]
MYKQLLKKIAHFQIQHPVFTILLIISLTIAIWGGVNKVQTVASLEQMMPKTTPEIKAFNVLRDNNLGEDMIAIVFELNRNSTLTTGTNDILDIRDYLGVVQHELLQEHDILDVYSIASLPENSDMSAYVNDDHSKTIMLVRTDIAANDYRMNQLSSEVQDIVDSVGKPSNIDIHYTGTPIIQQKLGVLINQDRNSTQWISTLFVFVIIMLVFRSFLSAIVPILVVFVSVNWLYGTMGYTHLPISTLAGGVAAMVIGIGIDFAIHIMNKFKHERKNGHSIETSIELAVIETGTALSATSLTTMVAFLAFLFGDMPEMGRFGMLMAIGIVYSFIFSIFGLPALLIMEEKIIYHIKKKMKFGIEHEFHLEEEKKSKTKKLNGGAEHV